MEFQLSISLRPHPFLQSNRVVVSNIPFPFSIWRGERKGASGENNVAKRGEVEKVIISKCFNFLQNVKRLFFLNLNTIIIPLEQLYTHQQDGFCREADQVRI